MWFRLSIFDVDERPMRRDDALRSLTPERDRCSDTLIRLSRHNADNRKITVYTDIAIRGVIARCLGLSTSVALRIFEASKVGRGVEVPPKPRNR